MERLGATDDEVQLRSLLVLVRDRRGPARRTPRRSSTRSTRLDDREAAVRRDRVPADRRAPSSRWPAATLQPGCASTASARREMRELRLPGIASTGARAVGRVRRVDRADGARPATRSDADDGSTGGELFAPVASARCASSIRATRTSTIPSPGWCCSALGAWGLLRDARPPTTRCELLVLADRFAYNRMIPTMAWERIAPRAEERGARADRRAARAATATAGRRELLDEARTSVDSSPADAPTPYRWRL